MRYLFIITLLTGISLVRVSAQEAVPASVSIDIALLDLPGMKDSKSTWELSFELRLINETGKYAAVRAGRLPRMEDAEKVGELIYHSAFTNKSLFLPQNRRFSTKIPLTEEIQNRLRNEPKDRIDLTKVKIDDNVIKQSREQESRAQVFLLYATALVYDAKTKKTTIVPINRIISFREHASLNFLYTLTIVENGYTLDEPMPKGPVKILSKPS